MLRLPLLPQPYYRYRLTISGVEYTFTFRYVTTYQFWEMDIVGGGATARGIPLAVGADLLFNFPGFPFKNLFIRDLAGIGRDPNFEDVRNANVDLVYILPSEVASIAAL